MISKVIKVKEEQKAKNDRSYDGVPEAVVVEGISMLVAEPGTIDDNSEVATHVVESNEDFEEFEGDVSNGVVV